MKWECPHSGGLPVSLNPHRIAVGHAAHVVVRSCDDLIAGFQPDSTSK